MAKAGRRRCVVWACFEDHPAAAGKRRVLCRFCQHDTVANPERMVRHIVRNCPNVDEQHKQICREYETKSVPARRRPRSSTSLANNVRAALQIPGYASHGRYGATPRGIRALEAPVDHMQSQSQVIPRFDPKEAQLVRNELVLALVTTPRTSWELLGNEHLRRALQRLQPDFEPPTATEARLQILPKLYDQAKHDVDKFLQSATTLTVVCSMQAIAGHRRRITWTAVNESGRTELLAVVPQAPAEYPEEIAERVVNFLQSLRLPRRPGCFVHLCNDSFGAAHLARGLLKKRQQTNDHAETEVPGVKLALTGGCMTQQTLFLFQDVLDTLPSVAEALDKCMDVTAFVTKSEALQNELERLNTGSTKLPLPLLSPRADDLHSFTKCVHDTLLLKDLLQSTLEENAEGGGELELKDHLKPEKATEAVACSRAVRAFADAVGDDEFWMDLNLASEVLQPFSYASCISECDHATSSAQLLLCWLLLLAVVSLDPRVLDTEKENFHMRVVDRIRVFSEDHVIACLMLDPRMHGLGLSAPGRRRTRLIIADLGERLIGWSPLSREDVDGTSRIPFLDRSRLVEQLLQYLNREQPFDDDEAWVSMTSTTVAPRLFWLEYAKEAPELTQVALGVLGYRAFVAPLERTWRLSTQRFHPQQRDTATVGFDSDARNHAIPLPDDSQVSPIELIRFHEKMRARYRSDVNGRRRFCQYQATLMAVSTSASMATKQYTDSDIQVEATSGSASEPAREENRCSGDAATEFRQFKSWLQRLDEHEKRLPLEDGDTSLQRFDADWLELGPESPQQIRSFLNGFLVGSHTRVECTSVVGTAPPEAPTHAGSLSLWRTVVQA